VRRSRILSAVLSLHLSGNDSDAMGEPARNVLDEFSDGFAIKNSDIFKLFDTETSMKLDSVSNEIREYLEERRKQTNIDADIGV
jgi:hypothetical protein